MPNRFYQKFASYPTATSGLALAIASFGWTLEYLNPTDTPHAQIIGAVIASLLLTVVLIKFICHPKVLLAELATPVIGSVLPTSTMAIMVISRSIDLVSLNVGTCIWFTAIIFHIIFVATFFFNMFRHFKFRNMIPSWFIPPVGFIITAVTLPSESFLWIANIFFLFGVTTYAIMLPIMMCRVIFSSLVKESKPTVAIFAAPASLSLAGYLAIHPHPSIIISVFLFAIALLMTSIIYLGFFYLLRLPFSPGYSTFTFPMVIGANALYRMHEAFVVSEPDFAYLVWHLANLELIIAGCVVTFVTFKYLTYYVPKPTLHLYKYRKSKNNNNTSLK